jgi:hypothetical protein
MTELERLVQKANEHNGVIMIRFNPAEIGEQWGIKYYPKHYEGAHYYAYHDDLNTASRMLIDELEGFKIW